MSHLPCPLSPRLWSNSPHGEWRVHPQSTGRRTPWHPISLPAFTGYRPWTCCPQDRGLSGMWGLCLGNWLFFMQVENMVERWWFCCTEKCVSLFNGMDNSTIPKHKRMILLYSHTPVHTPLLVTFDLIRLAQNTMESHKPKHGFPWNGLYSREVYLPRMEFNDVYTLGMRHDIFKNKFSVSVIYFVMFWKKGKKKVSHMSKIIAEMIL